MKPNLLLGDCTEKMRDLADNSIDAIVTDPPYGLAFMGVDFDTFRAERKSDNLAFQESMAPIFAEALRIAKPGAHLLAFGGTRTYHRLACAIEDTGWEIRDCIMWVYGSGFPKSLDVSKAIDKKFGQEREKFPNPLANKQTSQTRTLAHGDRNGNLYISPIPVSGEAKEWNGWGTCLKPAVEPIVIARKPLEGTVAANVLKYGTGAINIDGCRVPTDGERVIVHDAPKGTFAGGEQGRGSSRNDNGNIVYKEVPGRFPANLIHDGSEEVLALFPDTGKSTGGTGEKSKMNKGSGNTIKGPSAATGGFGDSGSAARFFYCAKASRSERGNFNDHVTVKPVALMRYLVRLVTRKGGVVLDPFMGSGTTGIAAVQEEMNFVGIERDPHYYEIATRRIAAAKPKPPILTQQELPL